MFTYDALVKLYNTIIKLFVVLGWIKDPNADAE